MINAITGHQEFNRILLIVFVIFLLTVLSSILTNFLQQRIIQTHTIDLNRKMQIEIFEKALEADIECYEDADFYNKFTFALQQSDARALSVMNTFTTLIGSFLGIGTLITLISTFEPILLSVVLINVIAIFFLNTRIVKIQHDYSKTKIPSERECAYAKYVFYQRESAKELRLFGGLGSIIKNVYTKANSHLLYLVHIYSKKFIKIMNIQTFLNQLGNSITSLFLAYRVLTRLINIADFITLLSASQQLTAQIMQLLSTFPQFYEHSMYISNFKEFMDFTPRVQVSPKNLAFPQAPSIQLVDVSFVYPKTNKVVLDHVNLKIQHGEKVALIGRNGAGKSTLIKLIARLYDPSEGALQLNGVDYKDYNIYDFRFNIGAVFQDFYIYSISIAENILMRPILNKEQDEEIINEALKYVDLYEKVNSLPDGIYTQITREFNNKGVIFSIGEMQKLAIARIYVKRCGIIILDEPSSALDPIAENIMFQTVLNLAADKTIIFISHRLTNMKNIDKIFFIEDGKVSEAGSHDVLMRENGKYAHMYRSQASKYI
jgi:ATP-binding cassette subfamily B protein